MSELTELLNEDAKSVDEAAARLRFDFDEDAFATLADDLSAPNVRNAVETWVSLCDKVFAFFSAEFEDGLHETLLHPAGTREAFLSSIHLSLTDVLTGSWVPAMGYGAGVRTGCVAEFRDRIAGVPGLAAPAAPRQVPPHCAIGDPNEFMRLTVLALDQIHSPPLERIKRTFELSDTRLSQLFGVSRQAIAAWAERGVPRSRRVNVQQVAAVADFLAERLLPGGPAAVLYEAAPAFNDESLHDLLRAGRAADALSIYSRVMKLEPHRPSDDRETA